MTSQSHSGRLQTPIHPRTGSLASVFAILTLAGAAHASYSPTWIYQINRAGLYGPEHTGSAGLQISFTNTLTSTGWMVGRSSRFSGTGANNGMDTWCFRPDTNSTIQIGLIDGDHTGSSGFRSSIESFVTHDGMAVGQTQRIASVNTNNGQSAWFYFPSTDLTVRIGLTDSTHTGSSGFHFTRTTAVSPSGQVAGITYRYTGVDTDNGIDAWVFNPATNSTLQIGYTGGVYTGALGRQVSIIDHQNQAGQIAGTSNRYAGVAALRGQSSWVFDPVTSTTVQTGLIGGVYTGSIGHQFSSNRKQNEAGHIVGWSRRYTGMSTHNGFDMWIYNPFTNTTIPIGLTGGAYTGSEGRQDSIDNFLNQSGQVAGRSQRFLGISLSNGHDTWIYNPTTNSTIQTNLTGGVYTGSEGYQVAFNNAQNAAGHVAGVSERISGVNLAVGQDTWFYNPATNTTVQTNLTGGVYTGSAGYQYSQNNLLNEAGRVAGWSSRITGVSTDNGRDTWAYDPISNTTVQTNLTGGVYTGSGGYEVAFNSHQNESGQIAGVSQRIIGASDFNGQDTWIYNPVTQTTVQTGLSGGVHAGSQGYQISTTQFQNESGFASGFSQRFTGVNTQIGQDAWYFDPITQDTYQPTLGIPNSIRTSDNFAFSSITRLSDDGFALGYYSYFAGGMNPAVDRAFIFRPDLGFSDLGELVDGGLSAAGWNTLLRPQLESMMEYIVGEGHTTGQSGNSRSIFVMRLIPAPSASALLALSAVITMRRRR